jgi:hypothetical protein
MIPNPDIVDVDEALDVTGIITDQFVTEIEDVHGGIALLMRTETGLQVEIGGSAPWSMFRALVL